MNKQIINSISLLLFFYLITGCGSADIIKDETNLTLDEQIAAFENAYQNHELIYSPFPSKIDTIEADTSLRSITISFDKSFSYIPFREENVKNIYTEVKKKFGPVYGNYNISIKTLGTPIEQLIPNFYRKERSLYDYSRIPGTALDKRIPLVKDLSKNFYPSRGLYNTNIALWHSHGWYYDVNKDHWNWQRARLFQTVEDLLPMSLTLQYLIPMLENAGANVFVLRERDTQINEVVVDNDTNEDLLAGVYFEDSDEEHHWLTGEESGFYYGKPPYPVNLNPFQQGTYRYTKSDSRMSARVKWLPDIPESGYYAVYISYSSSMKNVTDAQYTVYHDGGKTEFSINQQIGGGTWIYLGKFKFSAGQHEDRGVVLTNYSKDINKIVSADAVRFGGGMGIIERNGKTGGRPKFVEGAKYYLQYAGMPDTLVYNFHENNNDYNDDYKSRGEYVNYLVGAPFGPNKKRHVKGLGIPVDVSMAFHTDAGITRNDTTIGTLSIYSIKDFDSKLTFPDGVSRMSNRDFADIIQTQLVQDLKSKYDPVWRRRWLWEAQYSEASRPNVPSLLLEILSHQNFLDMKFLLDPRFQFDASRAIYKGVLKFLSAQYDINYLVQPLPVTDFSTEIKEGNTILLRWKPQTDPLEPNAAPDKYRVYTRYENGGFDNGTIILDTTYTFYNPAPGSIYSFKVAALNDGGESFPSEILSVCLMNKADKPVLIVNGFDRICAPASVETDKFSGFTNIVDEGVPYKYDLNFTGRQYDFVPDSDFRSNAAPGHGASFADYETKIIAGNTFDFTYIHGKALREAGFSFVSTSDESFVRNKNLTDFGMIDLILGEEKETNWPKTFGDSLNGLQFQAFPENLRSTITDYCNLGGNIFISGAYVGKDLFTNSLFDSSAAKFANEVLKFNWVTHHASRTGNVESVSDSIFFGLKNFSFNTKLSKDIYSVESPDAIEGIEGGKTILRYSDNQFAAASAYKDKYGSVIFGFPFETILNSEERDTVMKSILIYFGLL